MQGPCAKQTVTATIIASDGTRFSATNYCLMPQRTCPRSGMPTGHGYTLCREICQQPAHAEVNALQLAKGKAQGGTLYLVGHTYACESCTKAAQEAGIVRIVIGAPP